MVKLTCPTVKSEPVKTHLCPHCNSPHSHIHQTIQYPVIDTKLSAVTVYRMKCTRCHKTFRQYPEGIGTHSHRSKRLIFLGIILYTAGLSYDKVVAILTALLGLVGETKITVWRDVQRLGERLRRSHFGRFKQGRYVQASMDGSYFKVKGKEACILFSVDAKDDLTILFDLKREDKVSEIKDFLQELVNVCHLEGMVTDDWEAYKELLEVNRIPHQVCLAHVKKNVLRQLRLLPKSVPTRFTETVTALLNNPTPQGLLTLDELIKDSYLWSKEEGSVKTREIIAALLRKWKQYTEFLHTSLPKTNNHTERAIGRTKFRYRTTRGLKSTAGLLNFIAVTQIFGQHQNSLLSAYL